MENKKELWNSQQKLLRSIILKPEKFNEAIELCLEQHAMVRAAEMSQIKIAT